jgi:hypothetical protein
MGAGPVRERIRTALELLVERDLSDPGRKGSLAVNTATEPASSDAEVAEAAVFWTARVLCRVPPRAHFLPPGERRRPRRIP